jgi:hypothetical protein
MVERSQRSASANQPRAAQGWPPSPPGPRSSSSTTRGGHGGLAGTGAGQAGPTHPGHPLGRGRRLPGHGQQGRPLHPGRRVLVVVEAVQQEGVGAEQLAQGGEDLGRVGRPDLARALGLGQGQDPVSAGQ